MYMQNEDLVHGQWYLGHWAGHSIVAVMCCIKDGDIVNFSKSTNLDGSPMQQIDWSFKPICLMKPMPKKKNK